MQSRATPVNGESVSLVCPSCRTGEACHSDVIIKIFREAFDIAAALRPASLKVGEPWTPDEFVAQAETLVHPFDSIVAPDAVLRNVFTLLTVSLAIPLANSRTISSVTF